MRFIHNTRTDPAFNLAAEEWLLRNTRADVFMLWRNTPAVIVGRNQNTSAEIDEDFARQRGIRVIRRLTGGGAVFHDLGNVNFTFIQTGQRTSLDFQRFTAPILEALRALGVDCQFEGRNDLVIDGRKFSGNAQLIERDRVLHHGTLLFAAQMADLSGVLKVNRAKYEDKAVKSVQKRVTNISSHLQAPLSVKEFIAHVMNHVATGVPGDRRDLSAEEEAAISGLAASRYETWEWNFGSSPAYAFSRGARTPGGVVEVHLDVSGGRIAAVRIFGDFFGVRPVEELERLLTGCPHEREALAERLGRVEIGDYIRGAEPEDVLRCFF